MSKREKGQKQHFELSPTNKWRMDFYLKSANDDRDRVMPRLKIGDVVNLALDAWLNTSLKPSTNFDCSLEQNVPDGLSWQAGEASGGWFFEISGVSTAHEYRAGDILQAPGIN